MRARPLCVGLLALVAAMDSAAPATAKPPPVGAPHCVVWISPAVAGGHSTLSAPHCFTTFRAAQWRASGPAPLAFARATNGDVVAASTTISIDYDGASFTGATLTWTVSGGACSAGASYSAASMPSGWNDRVSSSKSMAGCNTNRHFHDTNFLGGGIVCTCATMGTMANETSSERWAA
jgi:hypothetical protein